HDQGQRRDLRVPADLRDPGVLLPELPRRSEQLPAGESAADTGGYRAGVVLPAVLRDPALGAGQARRRGDDVRLDRGAVRAALARHQPGAQRPLPPDLPPAHFPAGDLGDRARLRRRAQARGRLGGHRPRRHDLLLPALPGDPADPGQAGAAAAAAGEHQPAGDRARRRRRTAAWRRPCQADGEAVMRLARFALLGALAGALAAGPALAQEAEAPTPPAQKWSFSGLFGTYDLAAAQRGLLIYESVCSNCHSMRLLHYRDLAGIGLTPEQIK